VTAAIGQKEIDNQAFTDVEGLQGVAGKASHQILDVFLMQRFEATPSSVKALGAARGEVEIASVEALHESGSSSGIRGFVTPFENRADFDLPRATRESEVAMELRGIVVRRDDHVVELVDVIRHRASALPKTDGLLRPYCS
jgi:hypothetical protein